MNFGFNNTTYIKVVDGLQMSNANWCPFLCTTISISHQTKVLIDRFMYVEGYVVFHDMHTSTDID